MAITCQDIQLSIHDHAGQTNILTNEPSLGGYHVKMLGALFFKKIQLHNKIIKGLRKLQIVPNFWSLVT